MNEDAGSGSHVEAINKSLSNILKTPPPPVNEVVFDYIPLPQGTSVVCPPDEVLKQGAKNF